MYLCSCYSHGGSLAHIVDGDLTVDCLPRLNGCLPVTFFNHWFLLVAREPMAETLLPSLFAPYCSQARALLPLLRHSHQNISSAARQQLDELVASWWCQTLAASMVNPQIVKLAAATRMDQAGICHAHAVCDPPKEVFAQAVQAMRLSKGQKETIAAAYSTYLQALPERQRRHVLHHLAEAVEEPCSYRTEPVSVKMHEILDKLSGVLGKWQEACMALTTVSSNGE